MSSIGAEEYVLGRGEPIKAPGCSPPIESTAEAVGNGGVHPTSITISVAHTLQPNTSLLSGVSIYHHMLWGHLLFSTLPQLEQPDVAPVKNASDYRVFLGQIKREVTAQQVRWVIHRVSGVTPISVESKNVGCYYAYAKSAEEVRAMRAVNRRVLFDDEGIWIARDSEKEELMQAYVTEHRASFPPNLPKDAIVAEEPRPPKPRRKKKHSDQSGDGFAVVGGTQAVGWGPPMPLPANLPLYGPPPVFIQPQYFPGGGFPRWSPGAGQN